MKIYKPNGALLLDIQLNDDSYRHREIMGENNLTLYFSLAEHTEIPIGAYCDFENERYTLERPEALTMHHTRNFEYTVIMESVQAKAKIWKFRNPVDGRLKFPLTAKPIEHLQMFVDNMNCRDSGWTVGECIDEPETLISYDHAYCWDALGQMADTFKTEFQIVGKRVSLRKVEYNKSNPLPLSYGRGNGFKSGVGRSNFGETPPIEILYPQGGDRNIDPSKYGSSELHLPKGGVIAFDGEHFEDEVGFNAANARRYIADEQGLSVRRLDKDLSSLAEDSLDCSSIYPKRVGKITEVVVVNADRHEYDIIDTTIPDNLNYEDCLIEGEKMTIIFQDKQLAGKEFEVKYIHMAKNGKKGYRFEIVPQEIDGQTMPSAQFPPEVDGTYAVFHCMLPQAYINAHTSDTDPKTGAEWDMMRQTVKYLYDHEEQTFTFSGTLDGIWAKKDWVNIGGRIVLGGFVLFTDDRFQREGVRVRIIGIKDYINNPHSPEIELSNQTLTGSFRTQLATLGSQEVLVDEYHRDALQFTKRRFRDAQETMTMLESALLDNFTNSITPLTVQTMMMLVGDESLQFQFVNSSTSGQVINPNITYNQQAKQLHCPDGYIQHLTLGIKSVSSQHSASEYKFWRISEYTSSILDDPETKYFLYAVCDETEGGTQSIGNAEFILSETARPLSSGGKYNLLVGVLNSEYDGERSFVTLYGFTEVLPGRVTTDRVVSGNGQSFFDLVANALKLGDKLQFNVNGDGQLKIKGTIVQSQSGDENYIGCYRGVYDPTVVYYQGDEVSYTIEDCTSTYRFINPQPSVGIPPTNTTYWQVIAQGSQGERGADGVSPNTAYKSTVFLRSNSTPATPTGGTYANPVPNGWSDGIPTGEAKLWASTRIFSSDGLAPQQAAWSAPRQMTDTADFDVEFSSEENPTAPTGHPNTNTQWSNTSDDTTIWMATSRKSNGFWDAWQVSRIKGENGQDGTSINVQGTAFNHFNELSDWTPDTSEPCVLIDADTQDPDNPEYRIVKTYGRPRPGAAAGWITRYADVGDAFILNSTGHLFMADTDGWKDIGQFKGDKGDTGQNGLNAYVHIKYAKSLTVNDWSDNNGETPDTYIGIYTDNNPTDRLVWSLYAWKKWQGEDGFGYEYIYKRTTYATAPDTPTATSQADGYVPTGWTDDPTGVNATYQYEWVCYRKKTGGVWGAFIGSAADNTKAALWAKYGSTGQTGDYTEMRYAVNGSTTTPPSLTTTTRYPTGWGLTIPTVGSLQYLWMTSARVSADGLTLRTNWNTPVRITPYNGKDGSKGADGDSPVMVYRGIYSSNKTYYGNSNRLDCVKYGEQYYIARIDAGTFQSPAPPDTSKWNAFGSSFESIATNLLLAEGANIGDWFISGGKIVSTLNNGNKIELDALNKRIRVYSTSSRAEYQKETLSNVYIEIDATTGIIEARDNSNNTAYMSPTGIFANRAGTQCVAASSGMDQRASLVGLGFANVDKSDFSIYDDEKLVAGVYGNSSNQGTAPSYGGYFFNLKVKGLIYGFKFVNTSGVYLDDSDTYVMGAGSERCIVYLPASSRKGQTVFAKQVWTGYLRVYPRSGQKLYDDHTENEYFDIREGHMGFFTFSVFYLNGDRQEAWLFNRIKW